MRAFLSWMAGRKTYLMAGVVFLATVTLVFLGRLNPTTASAVVLFAISGFAATYRSALARHQEEEIAILVTIANAGKAAAARNSPALISAATQVVEQGTKLAGEIAQEQKEDQKA